MGARTSLIGHKEFLYRSDLEITDSEDIYF